MTIDDMIKRLQEHKEILGGNTPVWFFSGFSNLFNHEHAPFEVEEIEFRSWAGYDKRLIIK